MLRSGEIDGRGTGGGVEGWKRGVEGHGRRIRGSEGKGGVGE